MKKILIVIDMQNDFIDGSLGTEEARKIVPRVLDKIRSYPWDCIYATRDTHGPDYLKTAEGMNLPVEHCIRGTHGWEIREEIRQAMPEAVIVDKPVFGSTELVRLLIKEQEKEELELELIGLCTDICVVSNAILIKANLPEAAVSVDPSCCAGVTPKTHEAALETMKMCQIYVKEGEKQ